MPAPRALRVVALEMLKDGRSASRKLAADADPDTLHDFRVALRRLRSWLRTFEPELAGAARRKERHRLRDIARVTNANRDADVQLAWLAAAGKGFRRNRRAGADWLARYLEAKSADRALDAKTLARFEKVAANLEAELNTFPQPVKRSNGGETLAAVMAAHIVPHTDTLGRELQQIQSVHDEYRVHEARIAAKRLRYLVEPAVPFVKKGDDILKSLKSLQDELGALHDAHVIGREIGVALAEAATADSARTIAQALGQNAPATAVSALLLTAPRDGLLAIAERVREDADRAFAAVSKDWRHGQYPRFARRMTTFARHLGALR